MVLRILYTLVICAAITLLGILSQNVPAVAVSLGVLLVLWGIDWRFTEIEKRIRHLEAELANQRERGPSTDPLAALGDLKNPTPDELSRALGTPKP
jgi:hypothetical protein